MNTNRKNLLKTVIIASVAVLAVSAVLVFLKTRVQPPQSLRYTNPYTDNIHLESERIAQADEQALEQDFQKVTDRIELLKRERLISDEERTSCVSEFVNAYVPAFRDWCEQRFNRPAWPQETLRFMRSRIDEVKRYNAGGGGNVLSTDNAAKLQEVDKILTDYYAAWALNSKAIRSSNDSRTNLNKASQYKRDAHLSKCTALTNLLNNLPSTYQRSHFAYVSALVRGLSISNFPSASDIRSWADKYNTAKRAVNDYNSVATSLYHTSTSNFNLDTYYNQAKTGFRNKISEWDPASIRQAYENTFNVRIY